jgi:hypothetical protein
LIEDLRDAKQFEHQCKTLQIMNNSLTRENARLRVELDIKITNDIGLENKTKEGKMEVDTLSEQVTEL